MFDVRGVEWGNVGTKLVLFTACAFYTFKARNC
jgi:hypothetical protein